MRRSLTQGSVGKAAIAPLRSVWQRLALVIGNGPRWGGWRPFEWSRWTPWATPWVGIAKSQRMIYVSSLSVGCSRQVLNNQCFGSSVLKP